MHPTFVITTYTGMPQNQITVSVLSIPTDEKAWSPRLRVYLKAVSNFHARPKETPLGTLMVTNLSGFPSALTVIAVPDGNIRKHREDFIVNEDLKRLSCSGRAGLSVSPPSTTTLAKFYQSYRLSDRVPPYTAVIDLVQLCQVALVLFSKLASEYADGLLCDVTEKAINDWWTEIGTEFYNIEPSDGILGPTTVAALLGLLIGARNRLHTYGAPVSKDVFDLDSTKRGIAYFQKTSKLSKSRRLDRQTLDRLHRVTSKAASSESWTMPRAVKSTVAELSGKGGDTRAREKAGIADIETVDIDTFSQLGSGERFKWLWLGKPRKHNEGDLFGNLDDDDVMFFKGDEKGGYIWSSKRRDSMTEESQQNHRRSHSVNTYPTRSDSQSVFDATERDSGARRSVLQSMTGKMSDARSGLGRIKYAVGMSGLRGTQRYQKEGAFMLDTEEMAKQTSKVSHPDFNSPVASRLQSTTGQDRTVVDHHSDRDPRHQEGYHTPSESGMSTPPNEAYGTEGPSGSMNIEAQDVALGNGESPEASDSYSEEALKVKPILARPMESKHGYHATYSERTGFPTILRRSQSDFQISCKYDGEDQRDMDDLPRYPRHLSFSVIDGVVTTTLNESPSSSDMFSPHAARTPQSILAEESLSALKTAEIARQLQQLKSKDGRWAQRKLADVEDLDTSASRDQGDLEAMYHQKLEEHHALREATTDLVGEERTSLTEALKDVDVLGAKLEYEISALESKVGDVEDAVGEFQRQIMDTELRAQILEKTIASDESWLRWFFKLGRTRSMSSY